MSSRLPAPEVHALDRAHLCRTAARSLVGVGLVAGAIAGLAQVFQAAEDSWLQFRVDHDCRQLQPLTAKDAANVGAFRVSLGKRGAWRCDDGKTYFR